MYLEILRKLRRWRIILLAGRRLSHLCRSLYSISNPRYAFVVQALLLDLLNNHTIVNLAFSQQTNGRNACPSWSASRLGLAYPISA
jgi:hypothetical protein